MAGNKKRQNETVKSVTISKAALTNETHPTDANLGGVNTRTVVKAFVGGFDPIDQLGQAEGRQIIKH